MALAPTGGAGDAENSRGRRAALGSPGGVQVDAVAIGWAPGDVLVLCTDGLTNLVSRDELAQFLRANDFDGVAAGLVALANDRGGPDNITVLACRRDGVMA